MAKKQKTRYAILGALTVFPMSGYDIKKWISNVTGPFWAESPGRIYPTLKQLTKEKLITCDASQGRGKRPRKLYKITAAGLKILKEWLAQPAGSMGARDELRLKLFYAKNLSHKKILHLIQQQQTKMEAATKRYQEIEAHIKSAHNNLDDSYYWLLTLRGAELHCAAELQWCKEMLKTIKSKA